MGVGEEPGQGKDLGASPYPRAGDVWRSRDKRDKGLTVRVGWVDESTGRVHIRRFRQSSVAIRRWLRDYEFVSRRLRSGRLREGVVMGEEPERLRALASKLIEATNNAERSAALGDLYNALEVSAAAEVERLARDNEQHIKTITEGRAGERELQAEVVELHSQVERLAGERDALEERLETRLEDDAVYRVYDEKVAECERLAGERDEWERRFKNERRLNVEVRAKLAEMTAAYKWENEDRERLAGRVAALESTLRFYGDLNAYEPSPRRVRAVILDEGQLARDALADVGG